MQSDNGGEHHPEAAFILPEERLRGQTDALVDCESLIKGKRYGEGEDCEVVAPASPVAESKDSHSININSPVSKIITNKYLFNS